MPPTPLHLGLGILLCRLAPRLGCGAILAGSVLVDVEPGLVIALDLNARLHGPLHTLSAAILVGWLAGLAGTLTWHRLGLPLAAASWKHAMLGGIAGWAGHVILDSPLYTDITPLQPLTLENPLYMILGSYTVPAVYALSLALTTWAILWLYKKMIQAGSKP